VNNRSDFRTKTRNALAYVGAALVLGFALYGAVTLIARSLTAKQGEHAAEAVAPFVQGAASVAAEKTKEILKNTPDEQLEKDAELLSKKLYPVAKGALKGHIDAILKDANRTEVPEKMYEAGKDLSEKVVKPFSKGLADGSTKVLGDLDKTLKDVRTFREQNKDLFDSVAKSLGALHKAAKENPGFLPPPPPLPFPGLEQRQATPLHPPSPAPESSPSRQQDQDR
jgi:hypothetical protein